MKKKEKGCFGVNKSLVVERELKKFVKAHCANNGIVLPIVVFSARMRKDACKKQKNKLFINTPWMILQESKKEMEAVVRTTLTTGCTVQVDQNDMYTKERAWNGLCDCGAVLIMYRCPKTDQQCVCGCRVRKAVFVRRASTPQQPC